MKSKELTILEDAYRILRKYVKRGRIKQENLDVFQGMIDSLDDNHELPVQEEFYVGSEVELFKTVPYLKGVAISKYIGFDETDITIPSTINGMKVLALLDEAFLHADKIKKVWMSDGIRNIGDKCFYNCANLKEIRLSNTLKSIGEYAFFKTLLEHVDIPDTVYYIGYGAFSNTPVVHVELSSYLYSISMMTFNECSRLERIVVPEGITNIGERAFSDCTNLKAVYLPNGLNKIEDEAFCNCLNQNRLLCQIP